MPRPTPRSAIRAGLAYVPQERKTEGLLLDKSVGQNITLAVLARLRSLLGLIRPRDEAELVAGAIRRAQIRTRGGGEAVRNLSGGNQQKVLLERWLLAKPRILLLNDVTRGVDVGRSARSTTRSRPSPGRASASSGIRPTRASWWASPAGFLSLLGGQVSAELKDADVSVDRIVHAAVMGGRA